jgi:hypothetical protein
VRLAARDRTDAAIAKPETLFVRVRTWRPIFGNAWRAFAWTKPASSARSASAASSIWRRPLRLLGKDGVWPRPRPRNCGFPGEESGAGADHRAWTWGSRYNSSVLKLLQCEQAASDPAWPIVFDPRLGSLHARKPIKLLLRAVRPYHQDETAAGLRRKNLEGGLMFDCCHFHDFSNHPTNRGLSACRYPNRCPNIFSASRNVV